MVNKKKAEKHNKLRAKIAEDTKEPRSAQKEREGLNLNGKKGHQAMVKRRREEP
ncbi:MAG: hypothetical protein VW268_00415 [Rhodospirillaceae bacterium]